MVLSSCIFYAFVSIFGVFGQNLIIEGDIGLFLKKKFPTLFKGSPIKEFGGSSKEGASDNLTEDIMSS